MAPVRLAPVRLAPVRLAPVKSAPVIFAPVKSTPKRFKYDRSQPMHDSPTLFLFRLEMTPNFNVHEPATTPPLFLQTLKPGPP